MSAGTFVSKVWSCKKYKLYCPFVREYISAGYLPSNPVYSLSTFCHSSKSYSPLVELLVAAAPFLVLVVELLVAAAPFLVVELLVAVVELLVELVELALARLAAPFLGVVDLPRLAAPFFAVFCCFFFFAVCCCFFFFAASCCFFFCAASCFFFSTCSFKLSATWCLTL